MSKNKKIQSDIFGINALKRIGFFMQIIAPFYTKELYTQEAVIQYIEHYYPNFNKYYGTYERKNSTFVRIYRFYKKVFGQKKLYLFCRLFFLVEKESLSIIFFN